MIFFKVLVYVFERQNEKGRESMCEQRVKERKGKKEGGREKSSSAFSCFQMARNNKVWNRLKAGARSSILRG